MVILANMYIWKIMCILMLLIELVYMGSPHFGKKIKASRLKAIESASCDCQQIGTRLLELVNKEECSNLTINGQTKGKVAMDSNKREALKSKFIML